MEIEEQQPMQADGQEGGGSPDMEPNHVAPVGEIGAAAVFKNEFQKKNFYLNHPTEEVFFRTQWDWPQIVYVLYRVAVAMYIMAWLIYSITFMPVFNGHVWPAFLTNWSYSVLAIYLIVAAFVVVRRATLSTATTRPPPLTLNRPELETVTVTSSGEGANRVQVTGPKKLPIDLKIEWGLFVVISNFAFIVTLIYFGVLYPKIYGGTGRSILAVDLHIHGINSLVILIEMMISAYPVRLLHAVYTIMYGLTYVLFSIIYWAFDHENNVVYKNVLDWNKPGQTIGVIIGLGFVVIPIFQLALFGMYRLRIWIYERI